MEDDYTFLDLFAGAGGLTLGLTLAGWRCVGAVDAWDEAVSTYRYNFSDHPSMHMRVEDVTARQLARSIDESPKWIVGGPPCQGFSTVGKRQRTDPRNKMVEEFLRVIDEVEPEGFIIENVVGLRDMDFQGPVAKALEDLGYSVAFQVLRAADFGVPQLRHRVFFVGHRERGRFRFPDPEFAQEEYTTVWDAIGDLPPLEPGGSALTYIKPPETDYQARMRAGTTTLQGHQASRHPAYLVEAISHIPDGGNRRSIPDRLQPKSGFHNSYSRLASDAPAVAVTSNMGKPSATRCIHPFQHRGLTAREGARLQSFPDRFQFMAGMTSQRLQIANAVPPLLAEAVGRAIMAEETWGVLTSSARSVALA